MLVSSRSNHSFLTFYFPKVLFFGLLTLFCWMLAQWTWLILAPQSPLTQPSAKSPADLAAARNQIAASGLFTSAMSSTRPEPNAPTALNLKLVGVLATMPQREQSQAVLNFNNKGNEVFLEGSEIATGIVLHQITSSYVLIRRQGNLERVEFSELSGGISQATSFNLESQLARCLLRAI